MSEEIIIEIGKEKELAKLISKFANYDQQTVNFWWKNAKRRNHLLIIHPAAFGWTVISVMPGDKLDLSKRKIPERFKQAWLGQNIKDKSIYIFGNDAALEKLQVDVEGIETIKEGQENGKPKAKRTGNGKSKNSTTTKNSRAGNKGTKKRSQGSQPKA